VEAGGVVQTDRLNVSGLEPSEGSFYEWLCVFLDADTMSHDQLIEVPRKQLF
jgi:hypothetical protein